jgi:hypothetical protein
MNEKRVGTDRYFKLNRIETYGKKNNIFYELIFPRSGILGAIESPAYQRERS